MKTKNKIKTLEQYIKQYDDILYARQNDYDDAFNNLLYAREGIKTGKPDNFDWAGYLKNAENNYEYYSGKLAEAKYWRKSCEKAYPNYVRIETRCLKYTK
jgi:hypothetical protein